MSAFGGGFSNAFRPAAMGRPSQAASAPSAAPQPSGGFSAYAPGRAQSIAPPDGGTPYGQQRPATSVRGGVFQVSTATQKPVTDQAGYDAWSSDLRANNVASSNPRTAARFEQGAREQWGRWTQAQRDHAVREAKRRGPDAARANTTTLPFSDYTDPTTGEKFLADSSGRLARSQDLVNHYSSNPNSSMLARVAARYHDAGAEVPEWLRAAARNVNSRDRNAWYDLRYLDTSSWDSADDGTRYRIRGGR